MHGSLGAEVGELDAAGDLQIGRQDRVARGRFELSAVGQDILIDLRALQAERAAGEEAWRQLLVFVGGGRAIGREAEAAADHGAVEAECVATGVQKMTVVAIDVSFDNRVD